MFVHFALVTVYFYKASEESRKFLKYQYKNTPDNAEKCYSLRGIYENSRGPPDPPPPPESIPRPPL